MSPAIARLQRQARDLLPADVYDYYAGGSGRERTRRANERAWRQTWLAPRILRDVSSVDTSARLLGARLATPIGVAPTAYHKLAHPDGEVATAAGAARAGALFVLSTRSTCRVEDVGAVVAAANGTWWLQVYVMRNRARTADLVRRAAASGAGALVLTADTPFVGHNRRPSTHLDIPDDQRQVNVGQVQDWTELDQAPDVTFADIGWLSEISGGLPVVVKGVLRPDDARACAAAGAAAVLVSNHGGRQLDGALAAARALPAVAAALAGLASAGRPDAGQESTGQEGAGLRRGVPAYVDGGVRTGEDVLAALALGARAVFLGRPVLWALTVGGAAGVADLLTGLTDGLAHAMALAGAPALADVAGLAE